MFKFVLFVMAVSLVTA